MTRTNVQRFPNSPLPLHRTLAAKHSTKLSPAPLTRGGEGGWGNSDHPPRSLPLSDRTLSSLPFSIVREKPLAQRVPPMAAAAAKLRVTHSILSLAFASHLQSEGLSLPASRARRQASSAGSRNLSGPSARHEVHLHMHKCLGNGGTGQAGNRVDGSYWWGLHRIYSSPRAVSCFLPLNSPTSVPLRLASPDFPLCFSRLLTHTQHRTYHPLPPSTSVCTRVSFPFPPLTPQTHLQTLELEHFLCKVPMILGEACVICPGSRKLDEMVFINSTRTR